MNTPTTSYKGVDFAYPSSTYAAKFGHTRSGCWTITVYTQDARGNLKQKVTNAAYLTQDEACAAAAKMPEPWGGVWKRYMRHAIARAEGVTPDEIYPRPKPEEHYK